MRKMKNTKANLIIISLFFILMSMLVIGALDAVAGNGVAIKDGEFVLKMKDGRMFVIISEVEGGEVKISKTISKCFNVRYPEKMDVLVVPTADISQFYIKGWNQKSQ